MSEENLYIERQFAFCKISWEILNFCLVPGQEDRIINSPDFYIRGFIPTKWRMIIKREHTFGNLYDILFTLKRLECDHYSEEVKVEFEVKRSYSDEEMSIESFKGSSSFAMNFECSVDFGHLRKGHGIYQIKCDMLIIFHNAKANLRPYTNSRDKRVSKEMLAFYKNGSFTDCKIRILRDECINAHKVVLSSRIKNSALREFLLDETAVMRYDRSDVDKFLCFLYSGNLSYAVDDPSISMYQIALDSATKPVMEYYEPDTLELFTLVHTEDFEFIWTISNFFNRSEKFLVSPEMRNESMDLKWRWKVYPKGCGSTQMHTSIFLEVNTEVRAICFNISFDSNVNPYYSEHKSVNGQKTFGKEEIILCDDLERFLKDGSLTIFLSLRFLMGDSYTESESIGRETVKSNQLTEQRIYKQLSEDLKSVLKDPNHSFEVKELIEAIKNLIC